MNRLVIGILCLLIVSCTSLAAAAKGHFTGDIAAKWLPNGRDLQLTEPFGFIDARGAQWSVPKGATVNGASMPRPLWSMVGPPFTGKYRKSSVIYDHFCKTMTRPWRDVQEVFFEALLAEGNSVLHAKVMYAAVYALGPRWEDVGGQPTRTRETLEAATEHEFSDLSEWIRSKDPSLEEIAAYADVRFSRTRPTAEKRIALVIGNSSYQHTPRLINPSHDAVAISGVFKELGYEVIEGIDLDKAAMDRTIRQFARTLSNADAGIFFYAGHGLQVSGQNYLVPIDAKLEDASGLDFEMVRLDLVHKTMERETKTNVILLDACRDNPLARNIARALGTRSVEIGRGLAAVESGVGTLISFSTQPGNVALDGSGPNSPYAEALSRRIRTAASKEDLSTLLIGVRNDVMAATNNKQVPWEHSALRARFYFGAPEAEPQKPVPQDYDKEMEMVFWNAVKDSKEPELLNAYLERFPAGTFANLAHLLVDRMNRENEARKDAAAREEELKRAEETKRLAEAKHAEEQRKLDEARREEELAKARAEAERAREAAKAAEVDRQAALKAAEEARKIAEAGKAAQEAAAAREEELKRAEETERLAEAKRVEEQRKLDDAKRQELAKAREDAKRAEEALKAAEAGRLAALKAVEEARKTATAIQKAAQEAAAAKRDAEAKDVANAKRAEEQRKSEEAKRQEEQRRAEEALKDAEAERQAALRAAEEARKKAETAKAEQEAAALEAKNEATRIASLPRPEKPLGEQQPSASDHDVLVRAIQTELKRVGCDPGELNGVWGTKAKDALANFARLAKKTLPSDSPSSEALQAVLGQKGYICSGGQTAFDGTWRKVWHHSSGNCKPSMLTTSYMTIKNGRISGGVYGTLSGHVRPDGVFAYSIRFPTSPEIVYTSGKLTGNEGSGSDRYKKSGCSGRLIFTRIGR